MITEDENWIVFDDADKLQELGSHKEALQIFTKLAEQGHGAAMSRIALIHFAGLGVAKDFDESVKWDLAAIKAGYDMSMGNLALTYCAMREYREARNWFERAVAAGDGDSALELAKLLHVSDTEIENVKQFIDVALNSTSITPDSFEQAEAFRLKLTLQA
jgi:TPR repeat protein